MTTRRQNLVLTALLFAVAFVTTPWVRRVLPADGQQMLTTLRTTELNQQDATMLQRGYYEQLMGVGRLNSRLWEVYMNRPLNLEMIWQTPAGRRTGDYRHVELVPSRQIPLNGAVLTTNRWGMRDREYERAKLPGTFRIAVAGASTTMGWAVGDEDTFENMVETRLNRERSGPASHARYELLNFSVPGFVPPQYLGDLDRALDFQPDAYLLTTQDNDLVRTLGRLAYYHIRGIAFPDDSMSAFVRRATEGSATEAGAQRRLDQYGEMILTHYYSLIVNRCRERGVRPIWFFLPGLEGMTDPAQKAVLFRSATAAGFTILDLSDVYSGRDLAKLRITKGDFHPNVTGHRLIANALYGAMQRRPEIFTRLAPAR